MTNEHFIELEQDDRRTKTFISKSAIIFIESNGSNCFLTLKGKDQNGKQNRLTVGHTYDEIIKKLS